jgi:multidrug efflux pump subunit AcrA (membrane-fusion protein)
LRHRPNNDVGTARRGYAAAMALVCVVGALAGCEQPPQPKLAPSRPIERPTFKLAAGPTAQARLSVPAAALVNRGGIPGVFVLQRAAPFPPPVNDAEGNALPEARFRMVKPGRTAGGRVEILSGLSGDEVLVLGDLGSIHDGSPILARR